MLFCINYDNLHREFVISHVKLQYIAMATFGAKFFDTVNRSKTKDCKCNLSPVLLIGNQMVY